MEADRESVGGPLEIEVPGPVEKGHPLSLFEGEGAEEVDDFPVGEMPQLLQEGVGVGVEKTLFHRVHDHHHPNFNNIIIRLLITLVKEYL